MNTTTTTFKNFTLTTTYTSNNNIFTTIASNGVITSNGIFARDLKRSIKFAQRWVNLQLHED